MNKIKFFLKNERGYLFLNVLFLTLITSLSGVILINAAPRVKNPQPKLRLTALYLANERFAYLENQAANGTKPKTESKELVINNAGAPITFTVETKINDDSNPCKVTIKVKWTVDEKDFKLEFERMIWVAQ